jgi:hypothetical protein
LVAPGIIICEGVWNDTVAVVPTGRRDVFLRMFQIHYMITFLGGESPKLSFMMPHAIFSMVRILLLRLVWCEIS